LGRRRQLEEFFERAQEAFGRAPRPQWSRFRLGPLDLEIGQAGGLPQRGWTRPLALSEPGSEPVAGRILAWDDSAGDSRFPAPPWGAQYCYTRRGDIRGYGDDRFRLAYNYEARLFTMWDCHQRLGLYWTPSMHSLPGYEWAAPMRTLLFWLGLEHGLQLTHAAAVGLERGLLLSGKGGSGKSTTALACWHAGMNLIGDDYCWVRPGPPVTAFALYRSARISPNPCVELPGWQAKEGWSHDKLGLDLSQIDSTRLVHSLTIQALIMPRVKNCGQGELRASTFEEGLRSLALTTVGQLAGAGPASLAILQQVAQSLPVYQLDLVPPAREMAQLLGEFLRK